MAVGDEHALYKPPPPGDAGGYPGHPGFSLETRAIVAVVAILAIFWLAKRIFGRTFPSSHGSCILLVGPSGAGKTVLSHKLQEGGALNGTVAPMEDSEGNLIQQAGIDGNVHFVDLPGHPRLKDRLDMHISMAAGIIFMLDATDFMPNSKKVAEQLFDLLSHPVFCSHHLPLLLACNKADLGAKAHTDTFIVKLLEKEIESLRTVHSNLEGDGPTVGKEGEVFSFKHVVSKVAVAKISAITGDIGPVLQFTRDCIGH
ncbi:unnamed protein product [Ostreobium quekettii]|uniref:Signal recognition particle receptor subunit beta n=1 Tax=Ostreobium quekettii TaxID=121088 RepID=A0A8S1J1W8_9CHLO|nr:unnamed protein product [Ostreobium quekettii]